MLETQQKLRIDSKPVAALRIDIIYKKHYIEPRFTCIIKTTGFAFRAIK